MSYYENQTYYDILGLPKYGKRENGDEVSLNSIIKAKDRLKFGNSDDRAPFSMWNKIDEAYNILSDTQKRKEYDRMLEETKNNVSDLEKISTLENKENQVENVKFEEISKNNTSDEKFTIVETKKDIENLKESYIKPEIELEKKKENEYSDFQYKSSYIMDEDSNMLGNNSIVPKLKKVGKEVMLAIPTAVVATIKIIKELNNRNKYKLSKESSEKNITEVKTSESELEKEYRDKLDEKVDKVLDEYHSNYNLEMDKLRYVNNIELLNKKIELKENEVVKKGGLIKYKLQLTALKKQLDAFEVSLNRVNDKINQSQRKQRLSKIHENLIEINEQIKENDKKTIAVKKLEIRHQNLLNKKKLKISRMKSNREYYAIIKDSFTSARNVTENFVDNIFIPADKIDYVSRLR